MKKLLPLLLTLSLLCLLALAAPAALAETELEGTVQAGRVLSITAPFSGMEST